MKSIIEYAEQSVFFYQEEYPSITSMPIREYTPKEKEKLIKYLTNSDFKHMAIPAIAGNDAFTGKQFNAVGEILSDGEYAWYDSLPEYVRLHDIALPVEFIEHVNNIQRDD